MQPGNLYGHIWELVDNNNLPEALSGLMNLSAEYDATDEQMDAIMELVAQANSGGMNKEDIKSRIATIVEGLEDNSEKQTLHDDPDAIKLGRDNYLQQLTDPVVSCKKIGKKFGSFELKDVDIELRVGEITAVVGENGNGKTTLCRIIAGLLAHDSGELTYPYFKENNNRSLNWNHIKKGIAYLSQEVPYYAGTVQNTLQLEASLHGIKSSENAQRVDFIVRRLGLMKYKDAEWSELSGGYKLRFALARILIWRPTLLILDEPLANLDLKAQITVLSDLREYSDSISFPMSIVITSQHIHELEFIADKIIFIRNGETAYYGPINDIGEHKTKHMYEVGCRYIPGLVETALKDVDALNISYNGLYYEIETPLTTDAHTVLTALNDADIHVTFFRDISNSTKKLLRSDA